MTPGPALLRARCARQPSRSPERDGGARWTARFIASPLTCSARVPNASSAPSATARACLASPSRPVTTPRATSSRTTPSAPGRLAGPRRVLCRGPGGVSGPAAPGRQPLRGRWDSGRLRGADAAVRERRRQRGWGAVRLQRSAYWRRARQHPRRGRRAGCAGIWGGSPSEIRAPPWTASGAIRSRRDAAKARFLPPSRRWRRARRAAVVGDPPQVAAQPRDVVDADVARASPVRWPV